jgi:hypothetical protein
MLPTTDYKSPARSPLFRPLVKCSPIIWLAVVISPSFYHAHVILNSRASSEFLKDISLLIGSLLHDFDLRLDIHQPTA